MRRRDFLLLGASAAAWPAAAFAAQPSKVPVIGMLWVNSAEGEARAGVRDACIAGLADLGYVDGKTVRVVERFGTGGFPGLDALADELVHLGVDIVVTGAEGAHAAAHATKTIPIVTGSSADPVAEGLAVSLAHPGGNITGNAVFFPEIMAKRMELLKQAVPSLVRVGVLAPQDDAIAQLILKAILAAAQPLGVEAKLVLAFEPPAYEQLFAGASAAGIGGVVVADHPLYFDHFAALVTSALKHNLPTAGAPPYARAGGLIGYGVLFPKVWRHAATFVDKILKGAAPSEIPFEQATNFEMVANLKTARAIGVDVPQTLLAAADEVIE